MVPRTGNDEVSDTRLLAACDACWWSIPWDRRFRHAMPRGDHFHSTYAYEKSVTRHYAAANKFRQHRSRVDPREREGLRGKEGDGGGREVRRATRRPRRGPTPLPLYPLIGRDAFLDIRVQLNENVMHWQSRRGVNEGEGGSNTVKPTMF